MTKKIEFYDNVFEVKITKDHKVIIKLKNEVVIKFNLIDEKLINDKIKEYTHCKLFINDMNLDIKDHYKEIDTLKSLIANTKNKLKKLKNNVRKEVENVYG